MVMKVFQAGVIATTDHRLGNMVPTLANPLRNPGDSLLRTLETQEYELDAIACRLPGADVTQVNAPRQGRFQRQSLPAPQNGGPAPAASGGPPAGLQIREKKGQALLQSSLH